MVKSLITANGGNPVWIGLDYTNTWTWADGSRYSFSSWGYESHFLFSLSRLSSLWTMHSHSSSGQVTRTSSILGTELRSDGLWCGNCFLIGVILSTCSTIGFIYTLPMRSALNTSSDQQVQSFEQHNQPCLLCRAILSRRVLCKAFSSQGLDM